MSDTPEVDKQALYGRYELGENQRLRNAAARDRLGMRLAHKALDIPESAEDDVNVNVKRGLGWQELATVGALVLAATAMLRYTEPPVTSPSQVPQVAQPAGPIGDDTDSVVVLDFVDADE